MRGKPRKGHQARPRSTPNHQATPRAVNGTVTRSDAGPRRKTVLVIEDNASFGGLLVALLREEGYRSLRAWDVHEALKMARDRHPDLVILDLSLSYSEGLDLLQEVQAHEDTKAAPIVVVSAHPLELSPEQQPRVVDVVSKPFDIDKLLNVFRRALGEPEHEVPERGYEAHDTHLNSW